MVEIKRDSSSLSTSKRREIQEDGAEDSKHRLLYSKSRVYVHPTGKPFSLVLCQRLNIIIGPNPPHSVYQR